MTFGNIRSNYVKKKIKGLKWNEKNKQYIGHLILLEKWIAGEAGGWSTAMFVHGLKDKYHKDYLAIKNELIPNWKKNEKRREEKLKKAEKLQENKLNQEEKKAERQAKKMWTKFGGNF